ncbi:DNA polymerase epsilon catalytic subunit A-like [Benincasa hispida]|uniref:DNA polymerase epsilon catalytic subunit A-like n=1 Tax=Benincasa hispida TaxID=102211 RepID=UPI0018FFC480|nr:DNA polymerase epsilon catalytic subunit A-like [Benincasa hispida]
MHYFVLMYVSQFLGWQQNAAEIGIRRCADSSKWLNDRISLARYAHVLLGNIELDWKIFTADIFFSRALHDQQQIHHLAVNALLKSNQVNEIEGGGFDEAELYAPAFPVLKQLIRRCLADATTSGNVYADEILLNLYRWICSPQSRLHDPALHRLLHRVCIHVFALLLAVIRKLGATIIFANFSKVIIDTGKSDLYAAKAYCVSLVKTLQTRDLFEWIELQPVQFWHSLLFMDQYNYGGIPAKDEITDAESQVINILSNWRIAEYLPMKIQDCFITIVSSFIYIPWQYATKQAVARASLQQGDKCTPPTESFETHVTDHLKEQRMKKNLLKYACERVCTRSSVF